MDFIVPAIVAGGLVALSAFGVWRHRRHQAAVHQVQAKSGRLQATLGYPVSAEFSWRDVQSNDTTVRIYQAKVSARPPGIRLPPLPGSDRMHALLTELPGCEPLVATDAAVAQGAVMLSYSGRGDSLEQASSEAMALLGRLEPTVDAAQTASKAVPLALRVWMLQRPGEDSIWAMRTLARFYGDDPGTGPALEGARTHGSPALRCALAREDGDLPGARSLLMSPDGLLLPGDLWIWALERGGDDSDAAALRLAALNHPDDDVVRAGVVGMEARAEPPSVTALGGALRRARSDEIRLLLITALGKSEDPAAADYLRDVPGSEAVREMARWALTACGALEQVGGLEVVDDGEAEGGDLTLAESPGDLSLS